MANSIQRLRAKEWPILREHARVLPQADRVLATAWWTLLILRGLLPALFVIAMGNVVGAVQQGAELGVPLALAGVVFILSQTAPPIHHAVSANLGSRTASWLYDQLTIACVRPPGMGILRIPSSPAISPWRATSI